MIPARHMTLLRGVLKYRVPLVAVCLLLPAVAWSDSQQEFLLFGSVDTVQTFGESTELVEENAVRASADFLYSFSGDRFRFLAEYLWSSDEAELERLKAGWKLSDRTMLWFGRFHSTAKFWTHEYHHGQFLQNSITRPSMEEWEDESGPIPSHVTGFVIEQSTASDAGPSLDFAFSVGVAPTFVNEELSAFDLLDPRGGHGASLGFRAGLRPDVLSPMQIGFLVSWNDINVDRDSAPALSDLEDIEQLAIGAFADWRWQDWRVIANVMHFENDFRYDSFESHDNFVLSYVQFEYEASDVWTLFGRTDNGHSEDRSTYLRLLPEFIAHRHMLGARWDLSPFQSLTVEIADSATQGGVDDHEYFKELRFQWSAVFP